MSEAAALFVYGTLREGQTMSGLLARRPRSPARVRGALWDLPAGYPALVPDPDAGWVHGELIGALEPAVLGLIDHYEGVHEGLYRRVLVDVHLGLRTERAWAYVMEHPERLGGRRVSSGRWRPVRAR